MNKITYLCFVLILWFSAPVVGQTTDEIQRVRVDFVNPTGYTRHLLLAFTPDDSATDGVDYGYDALNFDDFPDDLNWIIEDGRYVIQGVGAFENTKSYPFGMFLTNSGEVKITLTALENFNTNIDVYIYDAVLRNFTSINNADFSKTLYSGNYLNRFYITFTNNSDLINLQGNSNALSIFENWIQKTSISYNNSTKELLIKTNSALSLSEVSLYDMAGKKLLNLQKINSDSIKIPLSSAERSSPLIVSLSTEDGKQLNKQILVKNM
jgi:hypothetical protein